MIVCSCNVLTERQVRESLNAGSPPRRVSEVFFRLGCSPQCGRCAPTIRAIMREAGQRFEGPPDEELPEAVLKGEA